MSVIQSSYQTALRDFRRARQMAEMQEFLDNLSGRNIRLLSYEEVAAQLKISGRQDRGIQQVPLESIIGSVGRYDEFTRNFLPRYWRNQERWARVKSKVGEDNMPPIEVYKVGEAYFVLDGNHRVSIARQSGRHTIDARVIEVSSPVPLSTDLQPDDLIIKAEYVDFLSRTHLAELRPNVRVELTRPGGYQKFLDLIELEFLTMSTERMADFKQACLHWYDEIYLPMVDVIAAQGLLRWFPGRTEADLVLWICEHRHLLEKELGWYVRPEAAVTDLVVKKETRIGRQDKAIGSWRQARMADRYVEHLFKDILVPLEGSLGCWRTLQQAITVAAREDAHLHGLHVVKAGDPVTSPAVHELGENFGSMCRSAGVKWDFHVDAGSIHESICLRALVNDLVIINTSHPPPSGLAGWKSGLHSLIWNCSRPLLAVCNQVSPLNHLLLAFDGSPKAREALFVSAYLAEQWLATLSVVILVSEKHVIPEALEYARLYLELHEIQAEYLEQSGTMDTIPNLMKDLGINLLLMGGYGGSFLEERLTGSLVNFMLNNSQAPVFICR